MICSVNIRAYVSCSVHIHAYIRCSMNIHASFRCSVNIYSINNSHPVRSLIGGHRATGRARARSSYDHVVCHPVGCVRSWGATRANPSAQGGPEGPGGAHKQIYNIAHMSMDALELMVNHRKNVVVSRAALSPALFSPLSRAGSVSCVSGW